VAPLAECVCPSFESDLVSGVLWCQCRWLSLESTVRKQLGGSNTAPGIDCFHADQTVFSGCILAALAGLVFALTAVQYVVARKGKVCKKATASVVCFFKFPNMADGGSG
jgi:hypothetical protein